MKYFLILCIALIVITSFNFTTVKADSPRMAVYEQFTSTTCGYCREPSEELHPWMSKNLDKIIPILYHSNDPFYVAYPDVNTARWDNYYVPIYGFEGIPAAVVGGNMGRLSIWTDNGR